MKKCSGKIFLRRRGRFGFTAVELTAVASIIAILSLILMPIVRKRVAESRLVAAADDMRTIQIAESLALADTGRYFRLSDLDNPSVTAGGTPAAFWNRPATATEFDILTRTWNGPYTTFSQTKFESFATMLASTQVTMFRIVDLNNALSGTPVANAGPILVIQFPVGLEVADTPVDPWGSPYVFFGDAVTGNFTNLAISAPPSGVSSETDFGIAIVYSLGPDGLPGGGAPNVALNYFREAEIIGEGDDLSRTF